MSMPGMNPKRDYQYLMASIDKLIDYLLNFLVFYFVYVITQIMYASEYTLGSFRALFLISIICLVASFLYNYYNAYIPMRTQKILYFLCRIFLVNMGIIAVSVVFVLFSAQSRSESGFFIRWFVTAIIISTVVLISKKTVMMAVLHALRHNQKNIKHILLVTDSQEMADAYMEEILNNPQFGYSVIGYVGNLNVIGLPHLGTTGDLNRILLEYQPDEVVMAFDTVRKKLLTKYISICNDHCIKVLVIPAVCGYFKSPRQISVMGNLPLLDIRNTPLDSIANQFLKRTMDVIGSLLLIIITSPLMLITAIGVRLSSPGPILFRQTRIGRHNKEFTMYKFRSMCVNESQETGWSTENDPRKTKFGAFIRKFALDELPQFFNVLKGDMSLVGPRPEVPYYVNIFKKQIPLYMLKHTLRPGITGLAQIKGLRGDTSIQARIEEDISYIENWTFWGDIRILLMTPFKAINRTEKYAKREKRDEEKRVARGRTQRRVEETVDERDEAD
ncbi:MAG: exopolysaccharide biosynthesis polyprenyl glycosylphosphotransferase [Clostridia bacterium]|nr:exopolysaccharide biosynthesis polyprenyl glycosylphosphotransferase [Clostridia bacterium]